MTTKFNPKLYREMCVPFENSEAADGAIDAFFAELYELRAKHRIADMLCIVQVTSQTDGGRESPRVALQQIGDSLKSLPLAAYAYGVQASGHDAMIAEILGATGKRGKR